MEYKICSKCGEKKSLSDFHKNGFDNQGNQKYRGYCKECANRRERNRYREKKILSILKKQNVKSVEKQEFMF